VAQQHAERVKDLVELVKTRNRTDALEHRRVYRPWGFYQSALACWLLGSLFKTLADLWTQQRSGSRYQLREPRRAPMCRSARSTASPIPARSRRS
jgi:hypothetical protein